MHCTKNLTQESCERVFFITNQCTEIWKYTISFLDAKINPSYFEMRSIYKFIYKIFWYNKIGCNLGISKTNYISYYKNIGQFGLLILLAVLFWKLLLICPLTFVTMFVLLLKIEPIFQSSSLHNFSQLYSLGMDILINFM